MFRAILRSQGHRQADVHSSPVTREHGQEARGGHARQLPPTHRNAHPRSHGAHTLLPGLEGHGGAAGRGKVDHGSGDGMSVLGKTPHLCLP